MRKPSLQGVIAFLITLFLISPLLRWIGLPTFYDLLVVLFGEPKLWNKLFALLFTMILIYIVIRWPKRTVDKN